MAKKVAKAFNMNDATYRKALSSLRAYIKIIENNLREKDYSFDYEKQPSKAMFKYRKAFIRNDGERYNEFIGKVEKGEVKLNASTLAPYELVDPFMQGYSMRKLSKEEQASINATWNSLPDYGNDENAIAVIDTSGSMYCSGKPVAASVALSLGIYFAERNNGYFKNHFIEFSARPQLIEIKGETFAPLFIYNTPTPLGPPNLCALSESISTPNFLTLISVTPCLSLLKRSLTSSSGLSVIISNL